MHLEKLLNMKKLLFLLLVMIAVAASAQPDHFITFNGNDQYMRIPHHSDFNIAADQSFTVTGWVRNETYTNNPRYICKRDMSVQSAGDERTGYEFFGSGNSGGAASNYCNGSFGNVRFYNMPLTYQDILTDYNNNDIAGLTAEMQANLLAAYDFTTANITNNQLADISGHGHTADLVNFVFGGQQILNVTLTQDTRLTGRGNPNETILKAAVAYGGDNAVVTLQSLTLNLEGTTNMSDIQEVKVYSTGTVNSFDNRHLEGATLLGSVNPASGDIVCNLQGNLVSGTNYLWITANVATDATEGNVIDASLKSITTADETYTLTNPSPAGDREIILSQSMIYQPGDYNSANYRIPAVITAKDGTIVAITDKRKYNEGDLPQDIDIVCNRSTDGGRTWTEPYTIAQGTGVNHGFGDCALAWSNDENGLIAVFVGGVGLWTSTPSNPIRSYKSYSYDNGATWTEPEEITQFIFGDNCVYPNQTTWRASFFGSGNGLLTSTGRIMFVAAIREGSAQSLNNYAVYSDDNGLTWHVSGRASVGGDEAKVTELVDGRILMSIRHAGKRWYNISEDGGETWMPNTSIWNDITAPACNGDLIRYTSVSQGHNKNRLLHSVPKGSQRTNVTVYISYDEGGTWPVSKTIVPYSSAYSSLCVLPDGTIGLYVEEEPNGTSGYSTVFYNFSLEWLTDGEDTYGFEGIAENNSDNTLKIYPVPASSYIMIEAENIKKIKIFDAKGCLVKKISVSSSSNIKIDISDLPSGVYLVEAKDVRCNKKQGRFVK